ncbi:FRIGIDA-like protein 5 [Salvia miltiorrhiza]|uniref:FRIGIDA-like protein 5 n=1 Tax=Salvia miltiorrhiza TaxID=226208 RepID=UPI0025AC8FED|nr:FRIGIDA-like protein 5 [Salvia miltiorrhiza]
MESFPAMASAEQLLCALRRTPARGGGAPSAIIDRVKEWKVMGESVFKGLVDCFSDIESREENLRSVSELLETRLGDLKETERELKLLHDKKGEALKLSEEELKLREEKLDEQLRLVDEHIEKLEASQGEVDDLRMKERWRLKEIEKRERELEKRLGEFEKRERELEKRLVEFEEREWELLKRLGEFEKRESELLKRLGEFEKREKEIDALHDGKLRELAFKEEVLGKKKTEFVEEVRLANEKIKEKQKLGYELIQRLELAVNMLGGMKVIMDERFKEIKSREEVAHESLTARLNEAELIRELLEKRFKELEGIEKELNLSQEDKTKEEHFGTVRTNEVELRGGKSTEQQKLGLQMLENKPEEKKQELELKQANLVSCKKEHDYEEHGSREKSLSYVRESTQTCAKENLALSKLDQPQRRPVGIDADEGQQVCRPSEVDLMEKLHDVHFKEQGSKQPMLTDTTDARLVTKQDESVDWKPAMHKNFLVMLISGPERDLRSMSRNMYKILSLSSDPAKLVVEVVEEFNALHTGILDTERTATILLLDQLAKLSPKIQPCVTEAAIKLALGWKSKISTSAAENPTEALAFLRLLAAYDLSSSFDKNELFSFLKLAEKHRHTRDLCLTFGLKEKIPDYIQELIQEKKFLLASTYIYEYQLQHMFSQTAILNYYATHSKLSANAQCRSEHNTSAAQEKAIATEIAALHLAIEHILKYGLESDYSPNALTARIKQLEMSQASFRRGIPFPSPNIPKQGRHYGPQQHLSKNARRRLRKEAKRSGAVALNPEIAPSHGLNNGSAFVWRRPPQHQSSQTKTYHAALPQATENLVQVPHPAGPRKRPRTNAWMNGGGLHLGQFANNNQC